MTMRIEHIQIDGVFFQPPGQADDTVHNNGKQTGNRHTAEASDPCRKAFAVSTVDDQKGHDCNKNTGQNRPEIDVLCRHDRRDKDQKHG